MCSTKAVVYIATKGGFHVRVSPAPLSCPNKHRRGNPYRLPPPPRGTSEHTVWCACPRKSHDRDVCVSIASWPPHSGFTHSALLPSLGPVLTYPLLIRPIARTMGKGNSLSRIFSWNVTRTLGGTRNGQLSRQDADSLRTSPTSVWAMPRARTSY